MGVVVPYCLLWPFSEFFLCAGTEIGRMQIGGPQGTPIMIQGLSTYLLIF